MGFDDPDIHQMYMSLVLHRKGNEDSVLQIVKAQPGSTVHLQSEDGGAKVFTIVDGLDADLHRGELLPSDPVALKLLGLGVGDSFNLKQTELETVRYRITKVESQYVFAFQDTLLNFSTWFPDVQGPEKLKADSEGIDKVLQMVNQRQAHGEMILEFYQSKRITFGMLAQLGGQSVIQTWAGFQAGDEFRIIASTGAAQEAQSEATLLLTSETLLLELTGFLTIASLELLPTLRRRFKQIVAPQFLLDQITDELTLERAGLRSGVRTAATLYREGDRYMMQEAPKVQTEERTRFLEGLLDFLRQEVTLLPVPDILEFPEHGKGNPLGRAALASISLAKNRGALLYSDDYVLRTVAKNSWGVTGVWSQSLLREFVRTNNISETEYHRSVIRLVQRNYHFVSLNARDYIWALRQDGMQVTAGLLRTLRPLEGPECTEDSAILAVGDLLRDVWFLEVESRTTRHLVLDACVSALKHGRHPFVVLSKLEARMKVLLTMYPEALAEVVGTITLWKHEKHLVEERVSVKRNSAPKGQR